MSSSTTKSSKKIKFQMILRKQKKFLMIILTLEVFTFEELY